MKERCPACGRLKTRSNAQNARYWSIVTLIAEKLKVDGKSFSPEVWHEWIAKKFLGGAGKVSLIEAANPNLRYETLREGAKIRIPKK